MKQRKQIKQYKKALNHIISIYKKRINNISNTIAYKELQKDIDNITKLIQMMLFIQGYNISIEGIFGNETARELGQFKNDNGI